MFSVYTCVYSKYLQNASRLTSRVRAINSISFFSIIEHLYRLVTRRQFVFK